MNDSLYLPLVEVTRGDVVESIHFGAAAIFDQKTQLILTYGSVHHPVYLRSSAKPLQALALLEMGGDMHFGLDLRDIALMCASHSGTDQHVEALQSFQQKVGVREADLQCGTHQPLDKETVVQLCKAGQEPSPLRHNCSGKHTGMLALSQLIRAPSDNYLEASHPAQQRILQTCAEMMDLEISDLHLGTDGCSAPVFAAPMCNAAMAYARLCHPDDLPEKRARACRLVVEAMSQHADMVAGPGKFDTLLMQALPGKVICKSGAEGFLAIGIIPNAIKPGSPALGITLKISDGDEREKARYVAANAILEKLGLFKAETSQKLGDFSSNAICNWRKLQVGEIRITQEFYQAIQDIRPIG